jgi:putative tryptophan/tyrosine transport system substrate-binding protein
LLQQMVPQVTRFWILQSRANRDRRQAEQRESARVQRVTYVGLPLDRPINEAEYRRVFAALAQDGADGILIADELEHITNRKLIAELAEKNRMPAIYPLRLFVDSGGFMSYGADQSDHSRGLAHITDQILKGAKPGDFPVLQPTKFELATNLKGESAWPYRAA